MPGIVIPCVANVRSKHGFIRYFQSFHAVLPREKQIYRAFVSYAASRPWKLSKYAVDCGYSTLLSDDAV